MRLMRCTNCALCSLQRAATPAFLDLLDAVANAAGCGRLPDRLVPLQKGFVSPGRVHA